MSHTWRVSLDAPICVRCDRPVVANRESYEVFERMHWVCFHFEFEHDGTDPDVPCGDWGCPMRRDPTTGEDRLRPV